MNIATLKDVREKLLGYRLESAADFARIPRERLVEIEEGDAPTVFEAEMLARVYGIEADLLVEQPVQLTPGDGVGALALLDEFRDLNDSTRARIVAAANAARDLTRLEQMDGAELRPSHLPGLSYLRAPLSPHRQGSEHADQLRRHLFSRSQLNEPIASMRDLVTLRFPSIALLYARLGANGPSGLAFSDSLRGATIVLNLEGKNENPLVRRFSLAHELYHILVDKSGHEPLATISGYLNERGLDRERRANSFAVRFICPQSQLRALRRGISAEEAVRKLERYGLPYSALRLYLRNESDLDLPKYPPSSVMSAAVEPRWAHAEEPIGIENFPLKEVPPERRTLVARTAARLYSMGKLRRGAFVEALGVTPASDVERILDFFELDRPVDTE